MALQDTWLNPLPNKVLYTPTTVKNVPTVGFEGTMYPNPRPDYQDRKAAHWVQLYGLKDMYERYPDKKWYFIVGCDTYLNVDHALRLLETYDHTQDLWIAKSRYPLEPMEKLVDTNFYPKYKGGGYTWSSGAWAWYLSNSVVKAYYEAIDDFLQRVNTLRICYCPDKVTGLILTLLGFDITPIPEPWNTGYQACAPDTMNGPAFATKEWSLAHYMKPRKMIAYHERVLHEKVDRLHAANLSLEAFRDELLLLHNNTLARKKQQLLGLKASMEFPQYAMPPAAQTARSLDEVHNMVLRHFDFLRDAQMAVASAAGKVLVKYNAYDIPVKDDVVTMEAGFESEVKTRAKVDKYPFEDVPLMKRDDKVHCSYWNYRSRKPGTRPRRIFWGAILADEPQITLEAMAQELDGLVNQFVFVEPLVTSVNLPRTVRYASSGTDRKWLKKQFGKVTVLRGRHTGARALNQIDFEHDLRPQIIEGWKEVGMTVDDVGVIADSDVFFSRAFMRALRSCEIPQLEKSQNCHAPKIVAQTLMFHGSPNCTWANRRWFHPDAILGKCIAGIGDQSKVKSKLWTAKDFRTREGGSQSDLVNAFRLHSFFSSAEALRAKYDGEGWAGALIMPLEDVAPDLEFTVKCGEGQRDVRRAPRRPALMPLRFSSMDQIWEQHQKLIKMVNSSVVAAAKSWFCPAEKYSPSKWSADRNLIRTADEQIKLGGECRGIYDVEGQEDRRWFCDKFPQDDSAWEVPKRYTPDDLVVGIYSGESIVYSRGLACQDTWLNSLPNKVIYTPTTIKNVPTVGWEPEEAGEEWGLRPDYKDRHSAQWTQLYGLRDMYIRYPDKDWYYIVGDDTYLNVDNALLMLAEFDATKPYWVSKSRYPDEHMPPEVDTDAWPDWKGNGYTWSSGAWGWFLSNPVAKAYAEAFEKFISDVDTLKICYCPDKVTGLLLSLLGFDITQIPGKWNKGYQHCAPDSKQSPFWLTRDASLMHYVQPRKMLALHERVLHEKVDRMEAGGNEFELWRAELVKLHSTTLKRKQAQLHGLGSTRAFDLSMYDLESAEGAHGATDPISAAEMHALITKHLDLLRDVQVEVRTVAGRALGFFNGYDIPKANKQVNSWFCPADSYSTTAWKKKRRFVGTKKERSKAGGICQGKYAHENKGDRRWFCDKLGMDDSPFVAPIRYTKDDLVVGIFTGETIVYSRGLSVQDTWLNPLPNKVLYTGTTLENVPTVGFERLGKQADWKDRQSAQWTQLYGLQDMYRRYPDKQWYHIVGCDTYVNVDNALLMLAEFDSTKPYWIAKSRYPTSDMEPMIDTAAYPRWRGDGYTWTSGAWGWYLSNPVAKAYSEALDDFMGEHDTLKICYCPDKVTGLFLSLLGFDITEIPGRWNHGYQHCAPDSTTSPLVDAEGWTLTHYLTPRKILALHELVLHEKADRMRTDTAMLSEWQAELIELHDDTIKRKQQQLAGVSQDYEFDIESYRISPTDAGDIHAVITKHMDMIREAQVAMRTLAQKNLKYYKGYDVPRLYTEAAVSWFCPADQYSPEAWKETRETITHTEAQLKIGGECRGIYEYPGQGDRRWYCNKFPQDDSKWEAPTKYTAADVVFGIATSESVAYSKGATMMDTWLNGLPNAQVYTATTMTVLQTTGFESKGLKHDQIQNPWMVIMYGIQDMYHKFPDKTWYFMLPDESYINVDHALSMLAELDGSKPIWLTKSRYPTSKMEKIIPTAAWPDWKGDGYTWSSKSWGLFLTNPVAKKFAENLDKFLAQAGRNSRGGNKICDCPDKLIGILLSLLGFDITEYPGPYVTTFDHCAVDNLRSAAVDTEDWTLSHYMTPRKVLALHERVLHEKADRMRADTKAVAAWRQTLIEIHSSTLTRKLKQIKDLVNALPPEIAPETYQLTADVQRDIHKLITKHLDMLRDLQIVLGTAAKRGDSFSYRPYDIPETLSKMQSWFCKAMNLQLYACMLRVSSFDSIPLSPARVLAFFVAAWLI